MSRIPGQEIFDNSAAERALLSLPRTVAVERFLLAAAVHGLDIEQAARLAVERELVLADGDELGISRERTRNVLGRAAADARPSRPLSSHQAAYVRALSVVRPRRGRGEVVDPVELPCHLLTRCGGRVRITAFDASVVGEMVAWERAAALEGRTMTEWALKRMASTRRAGAA